MRGFLHYRCALKLQGMLEMNSQLYQWHREMLILMFLVYLLPLRKLIKHVFIK